MAIVSHPTEGVSTPPASTPSTETAHLRDGERDLLDHLIHFRRFQTDQDRLDAVSVTVERIITARLTNLKADRDAWRLQIVTIRGQQRHALRRAEDAEAMIRRVEELADGYGHAGQIDVANAITEALRTPPGQRDGEAGA